MVLINLFVYQALTLENRHHIVNLFGPFEDVIIRGTKSFDKDLIPAIGKCIAIFAKIFTDTLSLKQEGHISKLLPRISVSPDRNRQWLSADSATRTLPISFIIQIMRLPPQTVPYEMLKWTPVSVWIHSLMEFKVTRQYDLLKAILKYHEDNDVKSLFAGIDMPRVERMARNIRAASSASYKIGVPAQEDVKFMPVLLRQFLVNLRRLFPYGSAQPKPAGLDILFLDLPQLYSRITTELEKSTVLSRQVSQHRQYMIQLMSYCAAVCPHLMFDPIKFSMCPMSEILSHLAAKSALSEPLPPVHYFLHGLAQTSALVARNPQTSYLPRFLSVLNALLFLAIMRNCDPTHSRLENTAVDTIAKSITPPEIRKLSLYMIERPKPAPAPQPQPHADKADPLEPTAILVVEGLTLPISQFRHQVLSIIFPSILGDLSLSGNTRIAISRVIAQIFSNLFSFSASHWQFGHDLLCFTVCLSDALSRLSVRSHQLPSPPRELPLKLFFLFQHTGRDLDARLYIYSVLSRALEIAKGDAKRSLEAKADARKAIEKAFVLIAHHIVVDCYGICSTNILSSERDAVKDTHEELLTMMEGLKIRSVTQESSNIINKAEWLKGVKHSHPNTPDESKLRSLFIQLAFAKIARFMQTSEPGKLAFEVLKRSISRFGTIEPRDSSGTVRKLRHEILTALDVRSNFSPTLSICRTSYRFITNVATDVASVGNLNNAVLSCRAERKSLGW